MAAPKQQKTKQPQQSVNICDIDLTQLPLQDLVALRQKIDDLLKSGERPLGVHDVVLEYDVKLRTAEGLVSENIGDVRLNSMMSPRLLGSAPARLETVFKQNVFDPINAAAYDLFDVFNPTSRNLESITTYTEQRGGLSLPPVGGV